MKRHEAKEVAGPADGDRGDDGADWRAGAAGWWALVDHTLRTAEALRDLQVETSNEAHAKWAASVARCLRAAGPVDALAAAAELARFDVEVAMRSSSAALELLARRNGEIAGRAVGEWVRGIERSAHLGSRAFDGASRAVPGWMSAEALAAWWGAVPGEGDAPARNGPR